MKYLGYILFSSCVTFNALAQDIHWTQFDHNPIFQNPANTGHFAGGNYRIHANYRDQWRSVTVPFQTLSISGDHNGFLHENLSVGMYLFNDVAGDGKFRTIEFQPSASWLFKLTDDSVHLVRTGASVGVNYRQFNADAFTFGSQWNGEFFDNSLPTNEVFFTERRTNATLALGANYEWVGDERKKITTGIGFFNINRPNQGFFGENILRERRVNFFTRAQLELNNDWDLLPSLQINVQGNYREFLLGSQARYILKDRLGEYRAVLFGAYIRGGDAGALMGGIEWQNWWAGISYDINYSSLYVASRGRGGVEFSLRYIFGKYKPTKTIFRVCPDFI